MSVIGGSPYAAARSEPDVTGRRRSWRTASGSFATTVRHTSPAGPDSDGPLTSTDALPPGRPTPPGRWLAAPPDPANPPRRQNASTPASRATGTAAAAASTAGDRCTAI